MDKIYLYVKDPFKSKYQLLIHERDKVEIKKLENAKASIDYSQTFDGVYECLKDYNPMKKKKKLIVFDDIIVHMQANKKLSLIVNELFLRGMKLSISLVFISQSYFKVPKTIRLNAMHYCIMKIPNKREIQPKGSNHSSHNDFKDFMKLNKDCIKEPFSFLVNDTTLP